MFLESFLAKKDTMKSAHYTPLPIFRENSETLRFQQHLHVGIRFNTLV